MGAAVGPGAGGSRTSELAPVSPLNSAFPLHTLHKRQFKHTKHTLCGNMRYVRV